MPGNEFRIDDLSIELEELRSNIESIDMESVKRKTLKRAAYSMAEMVRQAVVAEDDIISPAMNGPHNRGDGPSMATLDAWEVVRVGDMYEVKPHPLVEQRAVVLNYGYPSRITPNQADALKFEINGVPVYADSVSGPERTGYWQAAVSRFKQTDDLEKFAEEELRKEVRDRI